MNTQFEENPDAKTLLADGASESAAVEFGQTPANPEGDVERHHFHDRETPDASAEGDGHGDANTVGPKPATLDDAAAANSTDQSEGDEAVGAPSQLPTLGPVSLPKNRTGKLPHGGAPRVIGAAAASASADDSGDKAEVSQPVDALARPPILKFGEGELVPAEMYTGKVDVDKFAKFWFGAYELEDYLVIEARLADQSEYVACLNGDGELLSDPTLDVHAKRLRIPIKYRIHKDLTEAESRAFVLESQTGGRPLTPKQRRELRHAIVLALLDIRADSDERLTFAAIGRRVGYTDTRVRQIHRERQKSRDRNISDLESQEAPATPSTSGNTAKTAKQKKLPASPPVPAATASEPARKVAGVDLAQVAVDHLDIQRKDFAVLVEQWNEKGTLRFTELLAGHSGGSREELLFTLRAKLEFQAAADTAQHHLEGLLAADEAAAT